MIVRIMIIVALAMLAGSASAQLLYGVSRPSTGGGAAIPPACTNGANFSQACNSSVAAAIVGGFL